MAFPKYKQVLYKTYRYFEGLIFFRSYSVKVVGDISKTSVVGKITAATIIIGNIYDG